MTDTTTITKKKLEETLSEAYDRGYDDGETAGSIVSCAQCCRTVDVEVIDVLCPDCISARESDLLADLLACARCGQWLTAGRVVLSRSADGWALPHETCTAKRTAAARLQAAASNEHQDRAA